MKHQVRLVFEKQWTSAGLQPSEQPLPTQMVKFKAEAGSTKQATSLPAVDDGGLAALPRVEDIAAATVVVNGEANVTAFMNYEQSTKASQTRR